MPSTPSSNQTNVKLTQADWTLTRFMMFSFCFMSWKGREEDATCVLCSVYLCVSMEAWNRTEQQTVQFGWEKNALFERRTATDRTDTRCQRSLCNGGLWTHSNRSWSNIVISHTPNYITFSLNYFFVFLIFLRWQFWCFCMKSSWLQLLFWPHQTTW